MDRDRDQEAPDPACLIVEILPILDTILRRLLCGCGNQPWRRQQMEDHYQNILLLLIEDDYRRLRSHDPNASFDAWLYAIVRHYLADWRRSQPPAEELSEAALDALRRDAKQEEEALYQERVRRLREVFGQLSDRQRRLVELLRADLSTVEIAQTLGIEPSQVRKRKYELIKKVRRRLADPGAGARRN